jgi:hypothetical protein
LLSPVSLLSLSSLFLLPLSVCLAVTGKKIVESLEERGGNVHGERKEKERGERQERVSPLSFSFLSPCTFPPLSSRLSTIFLPVTARLLA